MYNRITKILLSVVEDLLFINKQTPTNTIHIQYLQNILFVDVMFPAKTSI